MPENEEKYNRKQPENPIQSRERMPKSLRVGEKIKLNIMNEETKEKFKTWVDLLPADGQTRLPERDLFFDFVLTAIKHGDAWDAVELDSEKVISDFPNSENIYSKYESLFENLKDFYLFVQKENNKLY